MASSFQHTLRLAGLSIVVAAALPLAAVAEPGAGTRTGPVVGPTGAVIDSPVIVQPEASALSVEAAFQSADANHDGLLSPDEVLSVPALASEFKARDKNADGALSLQELQTPRSADPRPVN